MNDKMKNAVKQKLRHDGKNPYGRVYFGKAAVAQSFNPVFDPEQPLAEKGRRADP